MQKRPGLPFGKQVAYAFGMLGWSMMVNLIGVILVYFYDPPVLEPGQQGMQLPSLITQAAILGPLNAIFLILSGGRLVDAVYDPLIAQLSDRSKNPKGRRIPIMKLAIVPSFLFCFLVFFPLDHSESTANIFWLVLMLIGFYVSSTTYIIPYNALLPEFAPSPEDKVRLSTFQSLGYVFGIGIASFSLNVSVMLQERFNFTDPLTAIQLSIFGFALFAAICMAITVFSIDERKYAEGKPSSVPIRSALKQTLGNRNFRLFIVTDFAFYTAITLITSGLIYFLEVLLRLNKTLGPALMGTMVGVSLLFYPAVNFLAKRVGKKYLVVGAMVILGLVFIGVYLLGKPDIDPKVQIFSLIAIAAIPMAALNILPNAILAEIIQKDSTETGVNKEAIYFAVRYFFVKIAQTMGIAFFSLFLLYGKDVKNDFGIRLNGLLGFALCLIAALVFLRFRETMQKK
jgi:glycoside/pentoside/hexuronide:cation symporter, GPH family